MEKKVEKVKMKSDVILFSGLFSISVDFQRIQNEEEKKPHQQSEQLIPFDHNICVIFR